MIPHLMSRLNYSCKESVSSDSQSTLCGGCCHTSSLPTSLRPSHPLTSPRSHMYKQTDTICLPKSLIMLLETGSVLDKPNVLITMGSKRFIIDRGCIMIMRYSSDYNKDYVFILTQDREPSNQNCRISR